MLTSLIHHVRSVCPYLGTRASWQVNGPLEKKAITPDQKSFSQAHFLVLQQMDEVSKYIEEHKALLIRKNLEMIDVWIIREHNKKFNTWFQDIIQLSACTSQVLKKLAKGPIFTIMM